MRSYATENKTYVSGIFNVHNRGEILNVSDQYSFFKLFQGDEISVHYYKNIYSGKLINSF